MLCDALVLHAVEVRRAYQAAHDGVLARGLNASAEKGRSLEIDYMSEDCGDVVAESFPCRYNADLSCRIFTSREKTDHRVKCQLANQAIGIVHISRRHDAIGESRSL